MCLVRLALLTGRARSYPRTRARREGGRWARKREEAGGRTVVARHCAIVEGEHLSLVAPRETLYLGFIWVIP